MGQTTLEQAKTVLLMSRFLSRAAKARLKYKHVHFLGTVKYMVLSVHAVITTMHTTLEIHHLYQARQAL